MSRRWDGSIVRLAQQSREQKKYIWHRVPDASLRQVTVTRLLYCIGRDASFPSLLSTASEFREPASPIPAQGGCTHGWRSPLYGRFPERALSSAMPCPGTCARIVYMTTLPVADARAQLSRLVDEAERTHERFEITRNGHRAAVLLGADDYDALRETIAVLADESLLADHLAGIADVEAGDTLDAAGLADLLGKTQE
jgi:antitoxin YefM